MEVMAHEGEYKLFLGDALSLQKESSFQVNTQIKIYVNTIKVSLAQAMCLEKMF